jgi:hypothetical protein
VKGDCDFGKIIYFFARTAIASVSFCLFERVLFFSWTSRPILQSYDCGSDSNTMSKWFYHNENGEKIEVTGGQLKGLAKTGRITPDTIVETEEGKTAPARKVKGLTFIETVPPETFPVKPEPAPPVATTDSTLDEALHDAVLFGKIDDVKSLVSKGANINARSNDGSTALSDAHDRGNMEIYNFLKENGAIEFEPKQVTQSETSTPSTTTVYVQPSATTPVVPATPATSTLQSGRYAASGTAVTMQIGTGMVTLYDGVQTVGNGSYRINGNTITITFNYASGAASALNGRTYSYTINSTTSFSGNGERWDYRGVM